MYRDNSAVVRVFEIDPTRRPVVGSKTAKFSNWLTTEKGKCSGNVDGSSKREFAFAKPANDLARRSKASRISVLVSCIVGVGIVLQETSK